jgi:MraZ protein
MADLALTGTYHRSIDDKGRMLLPKRMRDDVDGALFLTPGTDRCLELHSAQSLQEMAQRIKLSAAGSRQIKSFSRLFYAQAEQCEIDSLGRIRMPKPLIDYASIKKEIVILGVGSNWEIWDAASWQSYLRTNEEAFDRMSQATLDGIPTVGRSLDSQASIPRSIDLGDGEADTSIPTLEVSNLNRPIAPR